MLSSIISGVAAALVVYWLLTTVRGAPEQHGSRRRVAYGTAYKLLTAAFFPLSAFVLYAALQASPDQKTLALVIAGSFWLMTLYLAYEVFFVRLSYDDEFIYHQTPLRGQRHIPWQAVNGLGYSPLTQAFTLYTDGLGSVPFSPYADGHLALIEQAAAHLEAARNIPTV